MKEGNAVPSKVEIVDRGLYTVKGELAVNSKPAYLSLAFVLVLLPRLDSVGWNEGGGGEVGS